MLIAVDTGGTKTLVAAFNSKGAISNDRRFPTPRDTSEYIELVTSEINACADGKAMDVICLAVPGLVRTGVAVWCPNLGWENFKIQKPLAKVFDCPIIIQNDAKLAALSEAKALPETPPLCIYLTISTGIGIGVVRDGRLDPDFLHSEAGHMTLEFDGSIREWEDFASGRSIKSTYGKYARNIHNKHIWQQIADKISRGILALIPIMNPDTIIIGGSIGTYFKQYDEALRQYVASRLDKRFFSMPDIRQATHPEEAVVYGCYYYAIEQLSD